MRFRLPTSVQLHPTNPSPVPSAEGNTYFNSSPALQGGEKGRAVPLPAPESWTAYRYSPCTPTSNRGSTQ